jgi:hypothetical protein
LARLRVIDNDGLTQTDIASVEASDTASPNITLSVSPDILWPPNHKMVTMSVKVGPSDNCGTKSTCKIVSVSSDEPINGLGHGDKEPEWKITEDLTVDIRAERSGTGDGREYTITVECTDASENTIVANTNMTVPHDRGE